MSELIVVWFFIGLFICGPLAYHFRVTAGQTRKHAIFNAICTSLMPVLLFQDLEHARQWKKLFPEDSKDEAGND